jgi:hypothetical protein
VKASRIPDRHEFDVPPGKRSRDHVAIEDRASVFSPPGDHQASVDPASEPNERRNRTSLERLGEARLYC